jgi:predicted MFS family arabinose efflux permease
MSAAFFYAFATMQIPIAIYLDRIGAKVTMLGLNLIAVAGALIFATAQSPQMLISARVFLGIGMAANLMGTFKLISSLFAPSQFATLTTIVLSLGSAGNIFATTPLVLLVQAIGWRFAFGCVAGVNLTLTLVLFVSLRGIPAQVTDSIDTSRLNLNLKNTLLSIGSLFKIKDYWIISFSTFCRYGIYAAIQALYAGPFLINVMGLSAMETGNVLLCMNLGFICCGPIWGTLSDRVFKTCKWIIIPGVCGMAAVLSLLAFLPTGTGVWSLAIIFGVLGIFNSTGGIMYTHIKEKMPLEKTGLATTGINFFTMIGPAIFLQGLGVFMQHVRPHNALSGPAFHSMFILCGLCLIIVAVAYLFTIDR